GLVADIRGVRDGALESARLRVGEVVGDDLQQSLAGQHAADGNALRDFHTSYQPSAFSFQQRVGEEPIGPRIRRAGKTTDDRPLTADGRELIAASEASHYALPTSLTVARSVSSCTLTSC